MIANKHYRPVARIETIDHSGASVEAHGFSHDS